LYDEEDWVEGWFETLRNRIEIPDKTFPAFARLGEEGALVDSLPVATTKSDRTTSPL
jgi:hypothetical protein